MQIGANAGQSVATVQVASVTHSRRPSAFVGSFTDVFIAVTVAHFKVVSQAPPCPSPRRRLPRLQRLQRRPGLQPPLQIRSRLDRPRRPPNRPDRFRQSPTCRGRPCRRRSRRHRRRRGRCKAVPRTGPTRSVVEASREGAGTGAACQRTRIRGETVRSSRARRRFGELERLPSLDGHLRDCLASLRRERLSTSPLGRRRRDAPAHGRASSRTGSRGTFPTEAHARSGLVPRLPSAAAAALRAAAHVNRG